MLESAHSDAYLNVGGRIAIHRRLQRVLNAIPDEGMTKRDDFFRLVRPLHHGMLLIDTADDGCYCVDRRMDVGKPWH